MRGYCIAVLVGAALGLLGAMAGPPAPSASPFQWNLPPGFPTPRVPAANPMTVAKVRLGRYLFYDRRLSGNGTMACATCHQQALAFTDGKARSVGSTGELLPRGAMSLVNVAYSGVLTWANPNERSLEHQELTPMFSRQPVELGVTGKGEAFVHILRSDPVYRSLVPLAFPGPADPFTMDNVIKAIACFERTIISAASPYDRYHFGGDDNAVSASAKRGEVLFFSETISCFRCHSGFNFSDDTDFAGRSGGAAPFHNTGLYNLPGLFSYPRSNPGIYAYTGKRTDIGKFKTPTLRNIALTAPYMHDGSIKTLDGVLDHYAAGGRDIVGGPDAGNGFYNSNKDPLIHGFHLSTGERADLIAFLDSLTDREVVHDPRFANPWPETK